MLSNIISLDVDHSNNSYIIKKENKLRTYITTIYPYSYTRHIYVYRYIFKHIRKYQICETEYMYYSFSSVCSFSLQVSSSALSKIIYIFRRH